MNSVPVHSAKKKPVGHNRGNSLQNSNLRTARSSLLFSLLLLCFYAVSAQAGTNIDYAKDGKVAAAACFDHLSGKPPTTAITNAGFVLRKNTKRYSLFYKPPTKGGGIYSGAFR